MKAKLASVKIPDEMLAKHKIQTVETPMKEFIEQKKQENSRSSFLIYDYGRVLFDIKDIYSIHNKLQPFYDVSTNFDPILIELLAVNKVNFCCFSFNEVKLVRSITQNDILITSPMLSDSDLEKLKEFGNIRYFLVDNIEYMERVHHYHPTANFLIYYGDKDDENYRFGADYVQCSLLLKRAKEMNVTFKGCYLRFVDEQHAEDVMDDLVADLKKLFIEYGFKFTAMLFNEEGLDCMDNYYYMREAMVNVYSAYSQVYMTAGEHIHSVKVYEDKKHIKYYLTNGDLYVGKFFCEIDDSVPQLSKEDKESIYECTIYGPTCDTSDSVIDNIKLRKYKPNEHFIFRDVGCCSETFSGSCFNGFDDNYQIYRIYNKISEKEDEKPEDE